MAIEISLMLENGLCHWFATKSKDSDIIQMKELDLSSFQYNHKHILSLCADEHMWYLFDHEKIINVS